LLSRQALIFSRLSQTRIVTRFSMPSDNPARQLPKGAGFAGFRLQESRLGDQDFKARSTPAHTSSVSG